MAILRWLLNGIGWLFRPIYVFVIRRHWLISSIVLIIVLAKLLNEMSSWLSLLGIVGLFGIIMYKFLIEPFFDKIFRTRIV